MKALSSASCLKSSFLKALSQENEGTLPVWLMRQAGRFLPEYQLLRSKRSMQDLFFTKELIIEITKMPFKELELDAAILFSDILIPLIALGAKVGFKHQEAPKVELPGSFFDLTQIGSCSEFFGFLYDAIKELKKDLLVPLIGFSGGPLTLFTYLLPESKAQGEFHELKKLYYENPALFHKVIDLLTDLVINHLKEQINAGVDALQVFDSWAGRFPAEFFLEFAIKPMQKIESALKPLGIPLIYFSRNLGAHTGALKQLSVQAFSIDGSLPLKAGFNIFSETVSIQGNFDPALLLSNPKAIQKEVAKLELNAGSHRYIANLGHGVLPSTPVDNVKAFVDAIHALPGSCRGH